MARNSSRRKRKPILSPSRLEFLKLASKIKELERHIDLLIKDLLTHEAPLGIG